MQELSLSTAMWATRLTNKELIGSVQTHVTRPAFVRCFARMSPLRCFQTGLHLPNLCSVCGYCADTSEKHKHFDMKVFTSRVQH